MLPRPGLLPTARPVAVAVCGGGMLGMSAGVLADVAPHIFRGFESLAWWSVPALVGIVGGWVGLRRVRVEQRVVRLKFRLCTECGYSLHNAPQEGTCPECGGRYELDRTIRAWQTWLDR